MNFIDSNEFIVANDSYLTHHFYLSNENCNNNEDEDEDETKLKGKTVPDVIFFHSDYGLHTKNWNHQTPIRKYHHNILSYKINLRDSVNPF